MAIWFSEFTAEALNQSMVRNTLLETLGIVFTKAGDDFLEAKMPVEKRTHQPMGLLHGGASVALAESLGSAAGSMCLDYTKEVCVGLEINANHIRAVRDGWVRGVAKPIHIGRKTQVWEIKIFSDDEKLCCVSRITLAVIPK